MPRKQIHLAAHFPGVNNTTVWSDPAAGSHIDFSSFVHFARTAERAKFDFLFLAEGLRLREQNGLIYDLDVVGRPDTFAVLAALAAVTDRIGLTGTINSTFNEPYEVARQFASLDHLSGGRAGWNVVTSWDAFTGENFRRGGFLPQDARYERAREFLAATRVLFDSWRGDEIVADAATGRFLADPDAGRFAVHSAQFDIDGRFSVPRSPQGRPIILQAGDSEEGREFAAADADAIFTRHGSVEAGRAFYADVKGRLARYGRAPDDLKILPATTFVLGDTDADAHEKAYEVRRQQVSGATAIKFAEQLWNRDLSDRDPDGPLPDEDPITGENTISKGRASVRMYRDPVATANEWRALAEAKKLSLREVVVETTARQSFVGTPAAVADAMDEFVQNDASDGFVLVPHITPGGLDEFADTVVPLLQERGSFRTEYTGTTLREHLGLAPPDEESRRQSAHVGTAAVRPGSAPALAGREDRARDHRPCTPDTAGFGAVEPSLDHLVYAVPDLAAAASEFAAATGVEPAEGGRHLGRGTRNVLVGFGESSYLEIIGPDPEQPADPGAAVPFGLDTLNRARLVTWAVHPADLEAAAAASAAAGADLGPVWPLSRRTPAGELLEWRLASTHPAPLAGVTPFLIDWGATPHPAPALPQLGLRGLRATHPEPDAVSTVLDALGVRLTVEPGPPGLAALLDTPRGPAVLS